MARRMPFAPDRAPQPTSSAPPVRRPRGRRRTLAVVLAAALAMTMTVPLATAGAPGEGQFEAALPGIAPTTPQEVGEGTTTDLLYADVTEGLAMMNPPEANPSGTAELEYPFQIPKGRGFTPEVGLGYSSEGGSTWAGLGWDVGAPEIAVDTSFGTPRFCDGSTKSPACGNVESESYTLDGDPLVPNAVRAVLEPRVADRQDYTRKVETSFEQIIRHGDKPSNYWWEVRDKQGNIRYYGGTPDSGGPLGEAGTQVGIDDLARDAKGILTDASGNGVRWFLTAKRDIGVNLHRYVYETVQYKRDTAAATGWSAMGAGVPCPAGQVCPKHVYLSKILYTAASTVSGEPEDAAYEIRFVRSAGARSDAVLDGRGGVLDLDQDLLHHVDVVDRASDKVVTRYLLGFDADPHFGKNRLRSVSQIGCNGLATCPATGLKHTFSYFDDIAAAGSGFDTPATWDTGTNPSPAGGTAGYITEKLSGLGASVTNAGDGRIYVGFNPASPSKTGSVGGSFAMNGATNESVIEFMDLNGDSLPDKVYRNGVSFTGGNGAIQYQLNTSTPSAARTAALTFGATHTLGGFSEMPVQRSIGIQGGVEAYFGVYGVFNVGGQWSWVDSYFTDANGDGLPDLVRGTEVLFNHLVCAPGASGVEACQPTFSSSDALTRVPLSPQTVPVSDPAFEAMVDRLREAVPPIDTVRRWTAPFSGNVTIDARAVMGAAGDAAGGSVRVAIQKGGGEIASATLTSGSSSWAPATLTQAVTKGQSIYFRAGSRPKGNGDTVTWEATIAYAGGSAPDANGLNQRAYSLDDDFTLAGRPGLLTSIGEGGTMHYNVEINKTAATTDDLRPTVVRRAGANGAQSSAAVTITPITAAHATDNPRVKSVTQTAGQWCVNDSTTSFGCFGTQALANARLAIIGEDEVGRFRITASPTFAGPVLNGSGVPTA